MPDDMARITEWLRRQVGNQVAHIADWCEHGYGELSVKQEAGSIVEVNGFRYRKHEQDKLIE